MSFKTFLESKNVTDNFGTVVYTGGHEHHDPNEYGTMVDTSDSGHAHAKRPAVDEYGTVVDTSNSGHAHSKKKTTVKESVENDNYFYENDNDHLGKDNSETQEHLHRIFDKLTSHQAWPSAYEYTRDSSGINRYLINRHNDKKLRKVDFGNELHSKNLDDLMKLHKNPFYLDTYHGASFNPGKEAAKHPEGRVFMPAYTSTSISKDIARGFSKGDSDGQRHIIHFHHEPGAQGMYLGKHSRHNVEREYLLPRNVSWKIHPEPTNTGSYKIWHAYDMQHHDIKEDPEVKKVFKEREKDPEGFEIKTNPISYLSNKLDAGPGLPDHLTKEHLNDLYTAAAEEPFYKKIIMKHPNFDKQIIHDSVNNTPGPYHFSDSLNALHEIDPKKAVQHAKEYLKNPSKYTKNWYGSSEDEISQGANNIASYLNNRSPKDFNDINTFKPFLDNHDKHDVLHSALLGHGHKSYTHDYIKNKMFGGEHAVEDPDGNVSTHSIQQFLQNNPEMAKKVDLTKISKWSNLADAFHKHEKNKMMFTPRDEDGIHPWIKKVMSNPDHSAYVVGLELNKALDTDPHGGITEPKIKVNDKEKDHITNWYKDKFKKSVPTSFDLQDAANVAGGFKFLDPEHHLDLYNTLKDIHNKNPQASLGNSLKYLHKAYVEKKLKDPNTTPEEKSKMISDGIHANSASSPSIYHLEDEMYRFIFKNEPEVAYDFIKNHMGEHLDTLKKYNENYYKTLLGKTLGNGPLAYILGHGNKNYDGLVNAVKAMKGHDEVKKQILDTLESQKS